MYKADGTQETEIVAIGKVGSEYSTNAKEYEGYTLVETTDNSYTVLFKQGKSDVGDLSDIAKKLNKTDASITIVGSTSPEGSEKFNRNLALARANAVKDALVKAGVDKDRITVTNEYGKQRNATIILSK